jgi:hypothetical protein
MLGDAWHECRAMILLLLLIPLWQVQGTDFKLYLLDEKTVNQSGAVCLDGSPPGYYFRPGLTPDTDKWRIHFRGGGWCFTAQDCYWRLTNELGSSKYWDPNIANTTNSPNGFMSNDTKSNPYFANWNTVFIPYCDGSSYTANNEKIINYNGSNIYLRGFRVLNALFDSLDSMGLNKSTAVVLTGTSAGSLATFLHAEYLRTRLPSAANVVAMPDAGFFLDHQTVSGDYAFRQEFQGAIGPDLWNASSGTNQGCIASYNPEEQWHCFFCSICLSFYF